MNRKIYANPTFGGYMTLSLKRIFQDASEIRLLRVVEKHWRECQADALFQGFDSAGMKTLSRDDRHSSRAILSQMNMHLGT